MKICLNEVSSALNSFAEREKAKVELMAVAGQEIAERVIEIIETQEEGKQLAFLETTKEAVCGGADYSACRTIGDIAKVYSRWLTYKYL